MTYDELQHEQVLMLLLDFDYPTLGQKEGLLRAEQDGDAWVVEFATTHSDDERDAEAIQRLEASPYFVGSATEHDEEAHTVAGTYMFRLPEPDEVDPELAELAAEVREDVA